MFRKRRQPTPGFRIPPPYQPMTGERAQLITPGQYPYCAMMQIAAEDTHDDYVICRGYDTRTKKFYDYEEGNDDKPGFAVAKPYGKRVAGAYQIGQVFPALLPLSRLGQNPGVAATTQGHPADLDEEVEILYSDEGKVINWLLIDENNKVIGKLDGALSQGSSATVSIWGGAGGSEADTGVNVTAYDWLLESGADDIAAGKKVVVEWINGVPYVTAAECP